MAENHVGVLPVIDRYQKGKLRGFITQYELLTARDRLLEEERKRERILRMWPVNWYGFRTDHSQPSNAGDTRKNSNSD